MKQACSLIVLVLLSGCGKPGRDAFAEAEALAAQGKAEEAARMFELACCYAPEGAQCGSSDKRAAEVRIEAAEKAMGAGQFVAAERTLIPALATADGATAQKARERLASEELKQGIAYERALGMGKTAEAEKAMEGVAATKTPVAALARAWIEKERPAIVLAIVKAACGPKPEGSCSKAAADLRAAPITGPEGEEATGLIEAEERRVYPLRINAEAFLQNFAAVAKRDGLMEGCKLPSDVQGAGSNIPGTLRNRCHEFCGCTSYVATPEDVDAQIQKRRVNEAVWRKTMRSIADPEIVAALEERRKTAQEKEEIARIDVPRPAPAPKTIGGKK